MSTAGLLQLHWAEDEEQHRMRVTGRAWKVKEKQQTGSGLHQRLAVLMDSRAM